MKVENQKGFSLIELLIVVVIMGILSAIAIPYLKRAKNSAENGSAYATVKIMSQEQIAYFSQNSRYARLDELNQLRNGSFGKTEDNSIIKGSFTFTMSPPDPSNSELTQDFTIIATRTADATEVPYQVSLSADGQILDLVTP